MTPLLPTEVQSLIREGIIRPFYANCSITYCKFTDVIFLVLNNNNKNPMPPNEDDAFPFLSRYIFNDPSFHSHMGTRRYIHPADHKLFAKWLAKYILLTYYLKRSIP